MLDADILFPKNDPDYVESEGVARPLKTRHPDLCGSGQLALLPPVHGSNWSTKSIRLPSFYFNESNGTTGVPFITSRDEIDIPMAIAESVLRDAPAVNPEPSRRHPLATNTHRLPCSSHASKLHLRISEEPSPDRDRRQKYAGRQ